MNGIYNCTGYELKIPNIVRGKGIYLFDDRGKRYMDLESGVWCAAIGHTNERINEIITRQIHSLMHAGYCYSHGILRKAAESVLSVTNLEGGKCVFLCSGSEAIEISRQIAKHLTGKKRSMTLHDSYLGSYSSVLNRTEGWFLFNWNNCDICSKKDACDPRCQALQEIPHDISDFLFEPGSSSGFVRFPPKALISNIAKIVHENGGKIIVNEVTTGIGRTGKWFGHHHYDIKPDMIAIGKSVGNGYPVSVAVIDPATLRELEKQPFKYVQSHQNDPLGAAIVHEVIQTIHDDGLISEAEEKGAKFLRKLKSLVDGATILDARGRGLMLAIDLADERVGNEIFDAMIERGYIVCNRKSLFRIDPPLTITEAEFDEFIDIFRDISASRKTGGRSP